MANKNYYLFTTKKGKGEKQKYLKNVYKKKFPLYTMKRYDVISPLQRQEINKKKKFLDIASLISTSVSS